jgi:hypothetical protein
MRPIRTLRRETPLYSGLGREPPKFRGPDFRHLWRNSRKEQPESVLQVDTLRKSSAAPSEQSFEDQISFRIHLCQLDVDICYVVQHSQRATHARIDNRYKKLTEYNYNIF